MFNHATGYSVNDDVRPNPDEILESIQKAGAEQKRGKLKIFLGMTPGVGKTYAMLETARKQYFEGKDVVIGYVETHGRVETDALAKDLPLIPRKEVVYRDMALTEMDLDAVLVRRPVLVLVDELAHTNAPGVRHPKRYQDVLELLDAGIDVYTTLNVQHVESRSGTVREITGVTIHETVPDTIIDSSEIELIDLSPSDLLKRLEEGKVYVPDRASLAMQRFFREGNITALREIALRLAAEHVGQDVREYMQSRQIVGPWKTGHRLLVAVSPSPFSEQMVRWTRRLADSLECSWIALYVETSRTLSEAEQVRLNKHLELARELGADIRKTSDEDVVRGILRVARSQNVTQIVVGKPVPHPFFDFLQGRSLLHKLVRESGNIDLHVVRVEKEPLSKGPLRLPFQIGSEGRQYLIALGVIIAVTLLNLLLRTLVGYRSVGWVYLLAVVSLAMILGRGPVLVAATLSALLWNYLFLPPPYTFYVLNFEDAMMLGMYFVVAIAMGQLIARIRTHERMNQRREERATALYLLTLELAEANTLDQILRTTLEHLERAFKAQVAFLLPDACGELSGKHHFTSTYFVSEKELSAAVWAFEHGKPTGRFTDTLPMMEAMFLPLSVAGARLGVLGLKFQQSEFLPIEQRTTLDAFVRHIGLVLDRQRLREAETHAKIVQESEKFSRTLLNTVSHELRIPIAAMKSAVSGLTEWTEPPSPATQQAYLKEIQEASERLNRFVGNLLDMTRLEAGNIQPNLDWCDVGDLIHVSLKQVEKEMVGHEVSVSLPKDMPLVKMNFLLMQQVLTHLLLNAAVHTPRGTPIHIRAGIDDAQFALTVADRGPGLPPEAVTRIFDKFYRVPGSPAGGTGLGLSIVKGFVEVQGGRVVAQNRVGGGASFTVYLPFEKALEVTNCYGG